MCLQRRNSILNHLFSDSRHGHIIWYFVVAAILGILIYVPLIPIHGSAGLTSSLSICYGCLRSPPHFNSITTQYLGFGAQYFGSYGGISFGWSGAGGLWALLFANLLVSLAAITVALSVRFLCSRNGVQGASFQLSLGALGILAPVILIVLGVPPMWMNVIVAEEITNAGVVLVLTAIAELWWFRWIKQQHIINQSQKLEIVP